MRKSYAVIVAALAAATLVGGTNAAAAPAQPAQPTAPTSAYAKHVPKFKASKFAAKAAVEAPANPGTQFTALAAPVRVLDTRNATGIPTTTPIGPGQTITVDLSSVTPPEAEAAVLNLAGTDTTGNTFVTVYPADTDRPIPASNLNLSPGQTRSNSVTVLLPIGNQVKIYNNAGNVHLILDVSGYYQANTGSKFTPTDPTRVLDTRFGIGAPANTPVGHRSTINLDLTNSVPANATAVTFNLAGTEGNANTFITAFPAGGAVPNAANMNLVPGETSSNLVTVGLSADKKVGLFNNNGQTHLVADLAGYFTPDQGFVFFPSDPFRLYDTRDPGEHGPVSPGNQLDLLFAGFPPNTASLVASLAGTETTASMFVVAWPFGAAQPNAANLNLIPGQTAANMITVKTGFSPDPARQFGMSFRNNSGSVQLILDLAGSYAPPIP